EVVDGAELRQACDVRGRALLAAIVEHAADVEVGIVLHFQRMNEVFAGCTAADDNRPADKAALPGPAADERADDEPPDIEQEQYRDEPRRRPDAGEIARGANEEGDDGGDQEHHRPDRAAAAEL